ncbi:aldehyde dehydrogenase family protein [Brevibacillus ginsengisoli]|uniref:aldehyde dehydrogenase family protein n=1 Tax=Brevibacillus ginsengisoli TaxID=363854 RepID=UPI003CEBD950
MFKPSEVTSVTAVKLFEIIKQAGIQAGVANMIKEPVEWFRGWAWGILYSSIRIISNPTQYK